MSNDPPRDLPPSPDIELSRWTKQWREAEAHLRELLGKEADALLGSEAVRRNEAMLRDAERIARFGSWELDLTNLENVDANPLHWSDEVFRIFGYEPGEIEVSNENFFRAVHPEDRQSIHHAVDGAIRESRSYEIDHRIILPDGTIRHVHEEAQAFKDPISGRPLKMVGIVQDITEQKRKEESLRVSEERFASAFEYASIGMALVAPEGRFLKVNRALCALTGYTTDELLHRTFQDITHPDDLATDLAYVRQMLAEEIFHYQMPKRYFHKEGHIVWVLLSVSLVRDNHGSPLYFISQIQDITEQKITEQKLAEQAALIDEARDAIILRDMEHQVHFWNKGAERLYGWTASEAVGRKSTELFHHSTEKFSVAMQSILEKGGWIGELDHVTKAGKIVIVESRWSLLRDPDGRPKAVLCINTDITERKQMEAHFLRAQRMESIGTLASGIAHDLNNLLAPIMMGVDLLRHFGVVGPSLKVVEDIERSAIRGSSLVKQVLSFARGVEGSRITIQVRDVIGELESIIKNTFPKNITLETRIAPGTLLIEGDPTQLNQVLLNLCVNSRDAMPGGGRISIFAENVTVDAPYDPAERGTTSGRFVCLEVVDTGCGIPEENIEKIFDPFFTTKELAKGTGLGLATSLGIVRSHGGFLNVSSRLGKGTTFKIYLPAQADGAQVAAPLAKMDDCPRGNGEWILLVDDEISILAITRQILEEFGYQVLTAEQGTQAIDLFALHREKIALVMTDMMMPVMDGPATILALRQIDPKIRIMAASGMNENGNVAKAASAGVKHFLAKPYTTVTLLNTLKSALVEEI